MEILTSTTPSKFKYALYRSLFFTFGSIVRFFLARNFSEVEVIGKENLRGGPHLILMNHSCELDPLLINFFGERPLQFLISESFMRARPISRFLSMFGHVSKRKLDFDPGSLQRLKRWSDCGASVALFPEGVFSVFGEPSPLMPGIDQLVRFLNLPVVIVHLSNGDRVKPLWAKAMRKTKIRITIYPPRAFEKSEAILPVLTQKLFHLDSADIKFPSYSTETALGLAKALHVCPTCSRENSLIEKAQQLECSHCQDSWKILPDNTVTHPQDKNVKDLFLKSFQSMTNKWNHHKQIQSQYPIQVYDISKGTWVEHTQGHFVFGSDSISVNDLIIPYSDIQAHTQDWGEVIILKTKTKRWALEIKQDSRPHFVNLLDYILMKRIAYAQA